jgi:hypothetical protein
MTHRPAAAAISVAALLAIAGFTALGSVFEYPQILDRPTADILALFHRHEGPVITWFLVLVISAALLAPAAVLLGRLAGAPRGRWIAATGIAAAAVQVIGLSRWVLLVPWVESHRTFEQLHLWLGKIIGETLGYALTTAFTILVAAGLRPAWLRVLGFVSAALIATGVVVPLIGAAALTNFAGYVAWCLWLLTVAVFLWRSAAAPSPARPWRGSHRPGSPSAPGSAH